jgi:hypothetical protein
MDTIDLFSKYPFEKALRDEITLAEIPELKSGTVILREQLIFFSIVTTVT